MPPTKASMRDSSVWEPKPTEHQFRIPETIEALRMMDSIYAIGRVCGELLVSISLLISCHLYQLAKFHNTARPASISTVEFTAAVDTHIRFLRIRDGCTEKFPNDSLVERKKRRPRRKYLKRYISVVEACFKEALRKGLGGWMTLWTPEEDETFNRGVDKGLTELAWSRYPGSNVCLEAEDDWVVWLRIRCEEMGLREAKAGRKVFEDM